MQAKDIVTVSVISIDADEPIVKAANLMLQNRISGLPVVDKEGGLVGIVTEGDFLRRGELGTQQRRPKWLEFIASRGPRNFNAHAVHRNTQTVLAATKSTRLKT